MNKAERIAELVAEALNGETFDPAIVANVDWLPRFDTTPNQSLVVTVRPGVETSVSSARNLFLHTYGIDIGVMVNVAAVDRATLQPYSDLVQSIKDFCQSRPFPRECCSLSVVGRTGPDPGALRDKVFLAVIHLEFQGA